MDEKNLKQIGYIRKYYGYDQDSDIQQCFNCKYGESTKYDREKISCKRWNMVTGEEDVCDYFEFHPFWAFNCTDEDKERRKLKLENVKKTKEGCYIATAVYGGYNKPEVMVLRNFRDTVLKRSFGGRMFIKIYYCLSPHFAKRLKFYPWINKQVKRLLDIFVRIWGDR